METGIELIAAERKKQIDKHGFTGKHHNNHPEWYDNFQLQYAATTLMMHEFEEVVDTKDHLPDGWDQEWFDKLNSYDRKKRLIIAGALIAAELDRLDFMPSEPERCDSCDSVLIPDGVFMKCPVCDLTECPICGRTDQHHHEID